MDRAYVLNLMKWLEDVICKLDKKEEKIREFDIGSIRRCPIGASEVTYHELFKALDDLNDQMFELHVLLNEVYGYMGDD